jgi:hypothetical protein
VVKILLAVAQTPKSHHGHTSLFIVNTETDFIALQERLAPETINGASP